MRRPWSLYPLVLSFVLGVTPKALTEERTFTTIDFPGAASTNAYDINDSDEIVGRYTNADGTQHGYLRSPNGELTPIDVPGANLTAALGINSRGDIVGPYRLASEPMNSRHGFLLSNGQFTTFDFPGAFFTQPVGINDHGDIVGRYCTISPCGLPGSSNWHGFLLHEGEFTSIDFPEALQSTAWKINASGQIVGAYQSADGGYHVFQISMCGLLRDPSNPPFATIDFPEGINPWDVNGGINAWGDIVTTYCDTAPCEVDDNTDPHHGLLLSRGELSTIDFPGAAQTAAFGINAAGDIVGVVDGVSGHGFLISQEETRRGRRALLRTRKPASPAAVQE